MANSIPAAMIIKVDRREKMKAVMMRPSLVDCQLVSHVSIDKIEVYVQCTITTFRSHFFVVLLGIPLPPTALWRELPQHIPQLTQSEITLILEDIGYSKVCNVN